jgi:threonyl-tRNA synthetase
LSYAKEIHKKLLSENIRVELDDRGETLQAKIRDAQIQKIPYMFIVGDREEKEAKVSVRKRSGEDLGAKDFDESIKSIKKEIEEKTI